MKNRRYSGDDRHLWPFTFSKHSDCSWRPLGVMLDSGGDEDSANTGCNLQLHCAGYTLIMELPRLLPDFRVRHVAESWDATTVARLGRNWYDEVFPREYGFRISDGSVFLHYGPQTHDSTTTKSKLIWIPWKQQRHVRFSLYNREGEHFWSGFEKCGGTYETQRMMTDVCEKVIFEFRDYDGALIEAVTHIEEREWRHGIGWFKWLSWFKKPLIRRSLDLAFSKEVGPEKGSWKGGTTAHGIEMLPGELHEAAFKRYCEQLHRSKSGAFQLTFIGKVI